MSSNRNINWREPIHIAWLSIGLFLLINIVISLFQVFNKHFNPDELQHLHIGWLVAHGQILYRDFWEHHGPFYGLLNGGLIYLTNPEPTVRILFWSRLLSFTAMLGVMLLIWRMALQLSLPRIGAFLAVAVYSSLLTVQTKGLEMRPDPLQSLFWIWGLYLLIANLDTNKLLRTITAGAFLTLSILCNTKAGIGPFFVVVFFLVGHWLCKLNWATIWRNTYGMAIGAALVALPAMIYFWLNSALTDYFYYNFIWNLDVILHWSDSNFQLEKAALKQPESKGIANLIFFLQNQFPFMALSGVGAGIWITSIHNYSEQVNRQKAWLFIIAATGSALGWLLDLYTQYFLMFLPLWSILVSYALLEIASLALSRSRSIGIAITTVITSSFAMVMLWHSINNGYFTRSPLLTEQIQFTKSFVARTDRNEPVAVIWSHCGGYMFNQNVGYYWAALTDLSEIIRAMTGEHPHGQNFIDEMEARHVRYVIGMETWLTEGVSPEAMDYLRKYFEYSNCLWTRKS